MTSEWTLPDDPYNPDGWKGLTGPVGWANHILYEHNMPEWERCAAPVCPASCTGGGACIRPRRSNI